MQKLLQKYDPETFQQAVRNMNPLFECWKGDCHQTFLNLQQLVAHMQLRHPALWEGMLETCEINISDEEGEEEESEVQETDGDESEYEIV